MGQILRSPRADSVQQVGKVSFSSLLDSFFLESKQKEGIGKKVTRKTFYYFIVD